MKRITVTGGAGFVGSSLVRRLLRKEMTVQLLLREHTDTWRIADLAEQVSIIHADLANPEQYRSHIDRFGPDTLFHLAWGGVKGVDRNDREQLRNVSISTNLFSCAIEAGVTHIVGLGSQAEYGPCANRISESTQTRPTTLYGVCKLSTGLIAERLASLSGVGFSWLRLFSSYGPNDDLSWLIPYVTCCLLRGQVPELTAAEQSWDYIYVDDAADALIAAAETRSSGIYNLGSGQAYSLRHIIEMVRDEIDPRLELGFGRLPYRPDQVMHLEADISALRRATGWRPSVKLTEGVRKTVEGLRSRIDAIDRDPKHVRS